MQVIILCGGKGTRISTESELRPKPMIEIGGKPILWHIMKIYSMYGFNQFILATGYKGDFIKEYFKNDDTLLPDNRWEVNCVDTGQDTLKGGRLKRVEPYIQDDYFHLTYGDGVANINIAALAKFHKQNCSIGTVTAVRPPSRFGELLIDGDYVKHFEEKPQLGTGFINGGFFVFKKSFLNYLTEDENCDLEFGALQRLAQDNELRVFKHDGFWQCMDNPREKDLLNKMWQENRAFWKVW